MPNSPDATDLTNSAWNSWRRFFRKGSPVADRVQPMFARYGVAVVLERKVALRNIYRGFRWLGV